MPSNHPPRPLSRSQRLPPDPPRRQLPIFFWALVALAILLAYNAIFSPAMLKLHIADGRLYGSLVDVLHRATPVMLLSLGMTFVIATGGIDLFVEDSIMAMARRPLPLAASHL